MSDTIYRTLLGASLLARWWDGPMSRRKRSAAGRNRISIDVGDMKPDLDDAAERHGITLSDLARAAFRHYHRREDGGVSGWDMAELLLSIYYLRSDYQALRRNPSDPLAQQNLQQAIDLLIWDAEFLERKIPR